MSGVLVAAPMRVEEVLIRSAARGRGRIHRTGMGPARSRAAAARLAREPGDGLLVLGFCGGLDARSVPGEVVIAEQVLAASDERDATELVACADAAALADAASRSGLEVRTGTIVSVSKIALGERRAQLHAQGAIAVDMESAWLAAAAAERPLAVVRVVLDSPSHELLRPGAALGAVRAGRALRRVTAAVLEAWRPSSVAHDQSSG
jgi:4-hydroxy-3-methylbut-2-en-1-yl diphosphate reductase